MIKAGIVLIFIAELILFTNIILLIVKLDKVVNELNKSVTNFGLNFRLFCQDFKVALQEFLSFVEDVKLKFEEKKYICIKYILKNLAIYMCFFSLKRKHKKIFFAYNFLKNIYAGYRYSKKIV